MASTRSRVHPARGILVVLASLTCLPIAAQTPVGTPCSGLFYDTNTAVGLVSMTGQGTNLILQRFAPGSPAFRVTSVCVAGIRAQGGSGAYEIAIYSDAGGVPGTRLAVVPASTAAPQAATTWMTTDVSGSDVVTSGPFWAGIRESGPQVVVASGAPNAATALATSSSDGASWGFVAGSDRTVLVRVSGQEVGGIGVVPALPRSGLAALALALAIGGTALLKRA